MVDMHGCGRYAWMWQICMDVVDMHGCGRYAWMWQISMDVVDIHGCGRYAWIANKYAKFHAKRLNQSENIPKSFRGGATFFEAPCIIHCVT